MRLISLFFAFIVLAIGCSKRSDSSTQIFGHAATGLNISNAMYHDNSREAIDYALSLPHCSGVEVDVRMDAKGQLWLFHDESLDASTNLRGTVESSTSDYLAAGRYRTMKKERLTVLTPDLVYDLSQRTTFLDIKGSLLTNKDSLLVSLLTLNLDTSKYRIIVPNQGYFDVFKSDFPTFLALEDFSDLSSSFLENEPKLRGICIRNEKITLEQVNFLKSIHKKTIIYEVRSSKGISSALKKDPHYLLSDDLKLAIGLRY
ncbi:MAG: glycerophosphodiester phosphodiesterase [Bacteroidota bacterium]